MQNTIQKAIDQIGLAGVAKYLPKGMKLHTCEMHGMYLQHYTQSTPSCPACAHWASLNGGNGTTATEIEHFIDVKDHINEVLGVK